MSNHDFADNVIHDERLGLMSSYRWATDPKLILFVLARYQFVARMLQGYGNVLEVGCGDGFGSRLVAATVAHLTAIDIDAQMVGDAIVRRLYNVTFSHGDMSMFIEGRFDAAYALDVLEHVAPEEEAAFMADFSRLAPVGIIGMPSLESQAYASPLSKANHVNTKTEDGLRATMKRYYRHVFMWSMNDAVPHVGFGSLAHYRLALGIN